MCEGQCFEPVERTGRCVCGKVEATYGLRDRDFVLERSLMEAASAAAGFANDGGLGAYADYRAIPGGVRADIDADQETREELADARNYLVWGIEPIFARVRAGDSQFTADYERRLRALSHLVAAWHALHTEAH